MGKRTFSCVKWLLTIFNFIFLICGLTICGFGVWLLVSPNNSIMLDKNISPVISYILLGIGGLIILISFCGCTGAGLENRCLICLFFTVLCGIFVACLITSILVAIFKNEVDKLTSDKLSANLEKNYGVHDGWTKFWDNVQTKLLCCGVSGFQAHKIYEKIKWKGNHDKKVPPSCCLNSIDNDVCQKGDSPYLFNKGCMESATEKVVERSLLMIAILTCVTLLLVGGMVLSLVHLRNIRHKDRYSDYSHPL